MSDKKPVKRGVLSGLMGLFGDEEAAGQAPEGGGAPSPAVARADEPPHLSDRSSQGEGYQEDPYAANPRGPERRQTDVVREAYEPGWYRISAAMAVSEDEEDEQEEPSGPDAEADAQTEQPEVATEQQPEVDISTEQQQAVAENDQQQPEVATEEHPVEVVPEQPPEVLEEPAAARTIEEPQAADVGATPQFEAPSPEPSTYAGPVPETTDAGQDQVASEQISQPQEQALPAEAAEPGPPHEAEAVSPSPEDADGAATAPDEAGVAATAPDEAGVAATAPDEAGVAA